MIEFDEVIEMTEEEEPVLTEEEAGWMRRHPTGLHRKEYTTLSRIRREYTNESSVRN